MLSWSFWLLAVLFAVLRWSFSRIDGHWRAMRADPTLELPRPLYCAIWGYHWFTLTPWLLPLFYAFYTVWWRGLALAVVGVILGLVILAVERSTGMLKAAWATSIMSLTAIPPPMVASFFVLIQAIVATKR